MPASYARINIFLSILLYFMIRLIIAISAVLLIVTALPVIGEIIFNFYENKRKFDKY